MAKAAGHEGKEKVSLPIYKSEKLLFFRCVNVEEWVYGKNISALHAGNLRTNSYDCRYSELLPGKKISYWADSKTNALSEIGSRY